MGRRPIWKNGTKPTRIEASPIKGVQTRKEQGRPQRLLDGQVRLIDPAIGAATFTATV
jgi:hypothetical protein